MVRIEDYALLGDTHAAALVSRAGSIDWLCLPRFDSPACFAAVLDPEVGGHWRIAPAGEDIEITRRYRDSSMVLETTFATTEGKATVIDCLPLEEASDPRDPRAVYPQHMIVRMVRCDAGTVPMVMEYAPRFDYGHIRPWLKKLDNGGIEAIGGPQALELQADVELDVDDGTVKAKFEVSQGDCVAFVVCYHESHVKPRTECRPEDAGDLVEMTDRFWRGWIRDCRYAGEWQDWVTRSLMVLKSLTYSPTGGVVAAATTSLPESIGGVRNWDYRLCWLRDATFTLEVLMDRGFMGEAEEWRDWLLRAVAGDPEDLQIMYGVRGERRLTEIELDWLSGYEESRPVRIGNAAVEQFQLDVYGEVMDALHSARRAGLHTGDDYWELQKVIVDFVCEHWQEPDEGIWEVRHQRRHFVHSKVMAWVAVDRAVRAIERHSREGPIEHWRETRDAIRTEVMTKGYDQDRGHFIRAYDDPTLDAALLMLPLVGFIEATDPRMRQTIEAIERELVVDGFVQRYTADDGLPPGEGAFLMCTFWLANAMILIGREGDCRQYFERALSVANDVGLLSEEYDVGRRRLVGNFPQAFSHTALVTTAAALEMGGDTPVVQRHRE